MTLRQGLTRVGKNPYLLKRNTTRFLTCQTSRLFEHYRPVDVGLHLLSLFLSLFFLFFLSSLPFLILSPPNSFWSSYRTPFLIQLDTWQSPGHVFHMPLISPTHFMHDDTWLSMCQVFTRLMPHGTCPHATLHVSSCHSSTLPRNT